MKITSLISTCVAAGTMLLSFSQSASAHTFTTLLTQVRGQHFHILYALPQVNLVIHLAKNAFSMVSHERRIQV